MLITDHICQQSADEAFSSALTGATTDHPVVVLTLDDLDLATNVAPVNIRLLKHHLQLDTYRATFFGDTRQTLVCRIGIRANGLPDGQKHLTRDITAEEAGFLFVRPDDGIIYNNAWGATHDFTLLAGLWYQWSGDEVCVDVLHDADANEGWLSDDIATTGVAWDAFLDDNENAVMRGYRIMHEDDVLTIRPLRYDARDKSVTVVED